MNLTKLYLVSLYRRFFEYFKKEKIQYTGYKKHSILALHFIVVSLG